MKHTLNGTLWLSCLLVALFQCPRAVEAQSSLSLRLEQLLAAGIEANGAHAAIVAYGDAGERALIEVFERETAPVYVRLRALGVLQSFATELSARYFLSLVEAAAQPNARLGELHPARSALVLRRALEGLLPTAKLLTPAPELAPITLCLTNDDAHVRRAASELLATLDDARVEPVLTKQLDQERSRMVRASLNAALAIRATLRGAPR